MEAAGVFEVIIALFVSAVVTITTTIYLRARDRVARWSYTVGLLAVACGAWIIRPMRFIQVFFESFDIMIPVMWLFPPSLLFLAAAPFWKGWKSRRARTE